jgi:hypothetical protein
LGAPEMSKLAFRTPLKEQTVAYEARNHRRQHASGIGHLIGQWAHERAVEHGKFDIELKVQFQTPNDDPVLLESRVSLRNEDHADISTASDKEWNYKPAGFVSYGGVSGGLRAVQMEKQTLTTLKVVPIVEAVVIPMVAQSIADGRFNGNELQTQAAKVMLDELLRWAVALKTLRG